MRRLTLSIFADTIFFTFCAFLLLYLLFNYAIPNPYSIILAITGGLICGYLSFLILKGKDAKTKQNKKELLEYEMVLTRLNFMTHQEILAFMQTVFEMEYSTCKIYNNYLLLDNLKRIAIFKFGYLSVNKADIVKAYNKLPKGYVAEIYADKFDQVAKEFASLFNGSVILKDGNALFELLKKHKTFPTKQVPDLKNKRKKFSVNTTLLSYKKRKTYFLFGITFYLLSFISPIKWYYTICAFIWVGLGMVCLLFGKKQVKE